MNLLDLYSHLHFLNLPIFIHCFKLLYFKQKCIKNAIRLQKKRSQDLLLVPLQTGSDAKHKSIFIGHGCDLKVCLLHVYVVNTSQLESSRDLKMYIERAYLLVFHNQKLKENITCYVDVFQTSFPVTLFLEDCETTFLMCTFFIFL